MTIGKYGKRNPSLGLYQDINQSSTHETTRLLEDTVRIADETEEIGFKHFANIAPIFHSFIEVLLRWKYPKMGHK